MTRRLARAARATLAPLFTLATLALSLPAAAAPVTYHGDGYTVVYDAGSYFDNFQAASSGLDRRFGWDTSRVTAADATQITRDAAFDLRTFALPTLTVTADPGRLLSGLSLTLHGYVYDLYSFPVTWDAFLFDYRFKVGGAARSLVATLTPAAGVAATYKLVWALNERYAGPSGYGSFSFAGDAGLVLAFSGDGPRAPVFNLIGEDTDAYYTLQFDFRVDPPDLGTGIPTGATAPVPEPETWAMMLAGLWGLAGSIRRRMAPP